MIDARPCFAHWTACFSNCYSRFWSAAARPCALQREIPSLQQQRNAALDAAAFAEAPANQLAEQVEKLKAEPATAKEQK